MKTSAILLTGLAAVCLFTTSSAQVATHPAEPVTPPAEFKVIVPAAISELAAGYAAAVQQMTIKSTVIHYRQEGRVVVLRGIRSAKALAGVVLVTFSPGDMMALNAEQIVLITDGTRAPEPATTK